MRNICFRCVIVLEMEVYEYLEVFLNTSKENAGMCGVLLFILKNMFY